MFDELLSDLSELTTEQIDERLRSLHVELQALQAEQAALVSLAQHRQVHVEHSHRSINGYLRQTLNCSRGEASRLRSVAKVVDRVDGVGEAWLTGRIGQSQVARFATLHGNRRVRDQIPAAAPLLLDDAEHLSYPEFELCVERFVNHADHDGAHDARDDAVEHREAHVVDVGGMVSVSAHGGDPLTSAEMIGIFDRFREREFQTDLEHRRTEHGDAADQFPLERTARQRSFDALASIFRTADAATDVGAASDPLVNVIIDATTFAELLQQSGLLPDDDLAAELLASPVPLEDRRCETSNGVQIHAHDALRAVLAGHVRRVVVDSKTVVVDMGRKQRLFTGPAREAAKLLVRHCEHPGCELPADWCHVDHATEWANGGPTNQHNAGNRCGTHNTAKTRKRWRTKRAINGHNYTIRHDGSIILPAGARPPAFPHEPDDDDDDDGATPADIIRTTQHIRQRAAALTA